MFVTSAREVVVPGIMNFPLVLLHQLGSLPQSTTVWGRFSMAERSADVVHWTGEPLG